MGIYKILVMYTVMISHFVNIEVPRVFDVLLLMNILPCHEIKAYRDGKRLTASELIGYINKPVKATLIKEGILHIEI